MLSKDSGIYNNLKSNKAVYHDFCYKKISKRNLQRQQKVLLKRKSIDNKSSDNDIQESTKRVRRTLDKIITCAFCSKGDITKCKLHAAATFNVKINSRADINQVEEKTKLWRDLATKLNIANLIGILGTASNPLPGDLRSKEIFYHNTCYCKAIRKLKTINDNKNTTNSTSASSTSSEEHVVQKDKELSYLLAFKQIHVFLKQKFSEGNKMIKLLEVEDLFMKIIAGYGQTYKKHSTRFLNLIQIAIPDIKSYKTEQNATFVYLEYLPSESFTINMSTEQKFQTLQKY